MIHPHQPIVARGQPYLQVRSGSLKTVVEGSVESQQVRRKEIGECSRVKGVEVTAELGKKIRGKKMDRTVFGVVRIDSSAKEKKREM